MAKFMDCCRNYAYYRNQQYVNQNGFMGYQPPSP